MGLPRESASWLGVARRCTKTGSPQHRRLSRRWWHSCPSTSCHELMSHGMKLSSQLTGMITLSFGTGTRTETESIFSQNVLQLKIIPHDQQEKELASPGCPALPKTFTNTLSLGKRACPSNSSLTAPAIPSNPPTPHLAVFKATGLLPTAHRLCRHQSGAGRWSPPSLPQERGV